MSRQPDYIDTKGKEWFKKDGESTDDLVKRAESSYASSDTSPSKKKRNKKVKRAEKRSQVKEVRPVFSLGKTQTPTLVMRPSETREEAYQRLIARGWNLEQVPNHWDENTNQLHAGSQASCLKCRTTKRFKPAQQGASKDDKRFVHVKVNNEEDITRAWANVPSGRMPVAYACYKAKQNNLHMTLFYVPCHLALALALWHVFLNIKSELPSIVGVISKTSTINSELYPDKSIYELTIPRNTRTLKAVLSKISLREWVPHMTDHTGKLAIKDKVEMSPEYGVIYAKLNDEVNPDPDTYLEYLKYEKVSEVPDKVVESNNESLKVENRPDEGIRNESVSDGDSSKTGAIGHGVDGGIDPTTSENQRTNAET